MTASPLVRHLIESLVNPFFILLVLLGLSLLLLEFRGNSKLVRTGFLMVLIGFLVFSTGWLPRYVTHKLENEYLLVTRPNPDIHWVVVLGGGHADGNESPANQVLSSVSIKRLVEGVRLYRQLPAAKLLLSGGDDSNGISEAEHLDQVIALFAISPADRVLETGSTNTASQAVAIKKWLQDKPFYLVTSAAHMPRAMELCLRQGLHPIAAPTDFTYYWQDGNWEKIYMPGARNFAYLNIAWHEILGRIWMRGVGWC